VSKNVGKTPAQQIARKSVQSFELSHADNKKDFHGLRVAFRQQLSSDSTQTQQQNFTTQNSMKIREI
jgi:hypothetical protein